MRPANVQRRKWVIHVIPGNSAYPIRFSKRTFPPARVY